jgi:low temperature requirement protein LtrA
VAVPTAPAESRAEAEQRVTALELFFDLVFVFAITQVTSLLSANPTWSGLGQGLMVLAALWWTWTGYAWLTNSYNPEEGGVRLAFFGVMAAMLVISLAAPQAFGRYGVLFGCAYFVARALHLVLYAITARGDDDVFGAVGRLARTATVGPLLLIAAGFFDGAAQTALWLVSLTIDYAGPAVFGVSGWRVSPSHFAERHGLVVIIALGESIVAVGVGAAGVSLTPGVVTGAVLGLVVAAALWWAYFDVIALVGERTLRAATGTARAALARDSYSYLHLPMIAGIVLFAFGVKKTLHDVGADLDVVPAVGLCGGVALYLLGHLGFRLRNRGTINRPRLVTAAACVALVPLATEIPALASLGAVAALSAALIAFEAIRYRDARARVRAAA